MNNETSKLPLALFLLRISVFLVMLMWTIDKFLNPEHAAAVYEKFYFIGGLGQEVMYTLATLEIIILAGFLLGIKKGFTYGAVTLFHAVSTFSAYNQYLAPFEGTNLLFFAAWPMLAACITLFLLREQDTLLAAGGQ